MRISIPLRRALAGVLSAALLFGLGGCSLSAGGTDSETANATGGTVSAIPVQNTPTAQTSYGYERTELSTDTDLAWIDSACCHGDAVWLFGRTVSGGAQTAEAAVFGTDGNVQKEIPLDLTAGTACAYTVTDDAIWSVVLEGGAYCLVKLDLEGTQQQSAALPAGTGGMLAADGEGRAYIAAGDQVLAYNPDGTQAFSLTMDGSVTGLYSDSDGGVTVAWMDSSFQLCLQAIDAATGSLASASALENAGSYTLYSGGDYDLYMNNQTALYGYRLDSGAAEELVSWVDCAVDVNSAQTLCVGSDDSVYLFGFDDLTASCTLTILTRKSADQFSDQRKVLTYGTAYLDAQMQAALIAFNRDNAEYRIHLMDYSAYNTAEDGSAGAERLLADVESGQGPDILDTQNLPADSLAARGLLQNLYELFGSFSKEELSAGYRNAVEYNGGLYVLSPSFDLTSFLTATDTAGEGWSVADCYAASSAQADGTRLVDNLSKTEFLQIVLDGTILNYVNYEDGTCDFKQDTFRQLLELANRLPASADEEELGEDDSLSGVEKLQKGSVLMDLFRLTNLQDYRTQAAQLGDAVTLAGIPGAGGNGAVLSLGTQMSISSSCSDPAGAWLFLSQFLTESYQETLTEQLPVLQEALDKAVEKAMESASYLDENGNQVSYDEIYTGGDGEEQTVKPLSQAQADAVRALIDGAGGVMRYDERLMAIVTEQTAGYFDGSKTLDETVENLQQAAGEYLKQ